MWPRELTIRALARTSIKLAGKAWLGAYSIFLFFIGFKLMLWLQPQIGWIIAGAISLGFWITPPIAMALWSDECK